MNIAYFQRKSDTGHFSLEGYFSYVLRQMDALPGIQTRLLVCRFFSRGLFRRLWNMIEASFNQADINHITGDVHYLALLMRRRKTVLTIHDCEALERFTGLKYQTMLWIWFRLPAWRSGVVTVISEFSKRELLRYVPCDPAKVRVVSVCISSAFQYAPATFDALCPTILQVGTSHNKNLINLAHALKGIRCKLRVIGQLRDDQIAALEETGIDYSSASNLDEAELVEEYRRCDMLAFASSYEGFGMPILEANAVGRPVVTSSVCSMPEVGGDAVCYVDPADVESIRVGIERVIDDADYRQSLVEKGLANAERFSPKAIAEGYYRIYREMAGEGARSS